MEKTVANRPCVGLLQVFAAVCFNSSNKKMILVIVCYITNMPGSFS